MLAAANGAGLLMGPVRLVLTIAKARTKGHYRKDGTLTKGAMRTPFPMGKPDADKVARCVGDAGTGTWYRDDAQIVEWVIVKRWADDGPERTVVEVEPVT